MQQQLIKKKHFTFQIYTEWYQVFKSELDHVPDGQLLELGSGNGFIKDIIPNVITSDIQDSLGLDMIINAESIPFENMSLSCIMMTNVFHHISKPFLFLEEAKRTLKAGGKIIMIEPANTIFSKFIYKYFHHEPFEENGTRQIKSGAYANQALPYIYFIRDRAWYEKEFPDLKIERIHYHTPFKYLLSGGVSQPQLVPSFTYPFVQALEKTINPFNHRIGLFKTIVLRKDDFKC